MRLKAQMHQNFHQNPSTRNFDENFDAFELNQKFENLKKKKKIEFDGV